MVKLQKNRKIYLNLMLMADCNSSIIIVAYDKGKSKIHSVYEGHLHTLSVSFRYQ